MRATKRRTIVYIDGFNLFNALKERKWRSLYWLNIAAFAGLLMSDVQVLVGVKYFTSRVVTDPQEQKRQNTYLDAVQTLRNVEIQYGKFTSDQWQCFRCHKIYPIYHEKQTDVNIATALLIDAQEDNFDDALLVTADSDLVGPVGHITKSYPAKRVIVAFPPGRHSSDLEPPLASKNVHLQKKEFESSQFPTKVESRSGFMLEKPKSWI